MRHEAAGNSVKIGKGTPPTSPKAWGCALRSDRKLNRNPAPAAVVEETLFQVHHLESGTQTKIDPTSDLRCTSSRLIVNIGHAKAANIKPWPSTSKRVEGSVQICDTTGGMPNWSLKGKVPWYRGKSRTRLSTLFSAQEPRYMVHVQQK